MTLSRAHISINAADPFPFSALTLLVGQQEGLSPRKNSMLICQLKLCITYSTSCSSNIQMQISTKTICDWPIYLTASADEKTGLHYADCPSLHYII